MFLLMEKQHNRGQDGAGLAALKLDVPPGQPYIDRLRVVEPAPPWQSLIKTIDRKLNDVLHNLPDARHDINLLQQHFPYAGEVLLGHLRYGTHGLNTQEACHPVVRHNNWKSRTLVVAGNFNLTNVSDLFAKMVSLGQHPSLNTDTVTVLERLGHFLEKHNDELYENYRSMGRTKHEISGLIADHLDIQHVLSETAEKWDGGYLMGGFVGTGHLFAMRDPSGIRPGHYYENDEVIAIASERQAIATTFNVPIDEIPEIPPAHAVIVDAEGHLKIAQFAEIKERRSCSFERIYFSRGSDPEIYHERKALGYQLAERVLRRLNYELDNTVFSYIPNTAMVAFEGFVHGLEDYLNQQKISLLQNMAQPADPQLMRQVLERRIRVESVIQKDTKLRTFITNDSDREGMAAHVYDVTHGILRPGEDNVVCIDDSIVRGTTLKQSILRMLARLQPKRIVIVSSAPQIRYPDCYGIDMSRIGKFVAFQAAIALLKERGQQHLIDTAYEQARHALLTHKAEEVNYVQQIYAPFSQEEISDKIGQLLDPGLGIPVHVVYQTVEGLHSAIPVNNGDWYFTGNYPTPGGNRVVNQAFVNYYEGRDERAY